MTKDILTIDSDESVLEACKEYSEHNVGSLVVKNNGIVVGIVTERDIIQNMILSKGDPKDTKIKEIMTPRIKTVHALANVEKVAAIMKENQIKRVPVVLNNEIVGIVSETDISQTIYAFSEAIEEMTELYQESRETLENIIEEWGNIIVKLKNYKKLSYKKPETEEMEKEELNV
ncbi:MAG: CBS domain-containing protein [Candidatus Thermoplasmatota archaeon]